MSEELVNHPNHYGGDTVYETIKVLEAWFGPEATQLFCIMNTIKYLSRAGKKTSEAKMRDFEKAMWYMKYAIDLEKRIVREKKA